MIIFILCSFYILWNRVIFLFLCIVSQCKCPRFSGTNHRHSGTNVLEICFLAPSTVLLLYNWTYSSFRSTHSTEVYMDNTLCISLYKTENVCFYLHKVGHTVHTFKLTATALNTKLKGDITGWTRSFGNLLIRFRIIAFSIRVLLLYAKV